MPSADFGEISILGTICGAIIVKNVEILSFFEFFALLMEDSVPTKSHIESALDYIHSES